jgi:hypothetical protein
VLLSLSGAGKGNEEVTLVDIARRLKTIEEIVHPIELVPDVIVTLEGTVHDQGQQQATLNIPLTCIECQIQEPVHGIHGHKMTLVLFFSFFF